MIVGIIDDKQGVTIWLDNGDIIEYYPKDWKSDNKSIPDWQKEIEEEYEYLHWDIR